MDGWMDYFFEVKVLTDVVANNNRTCNLRKQRVLKKNSIILHYFLHLRSPPVCCSLAKLRIVRFLQIIISHDITISYIIYYSENIYIYIYRKD